MIVYFHEMKHTRFYTNSCRDLHKQNRIELMTRLDTIQQHSTPKAKRVVATVPAQKDWFDTLDDEETKDKRALVYDVTTPKQQVWPLTQLFSVSFL